MAAKLVSSNPSRIQTVVPLAMVTAAGSGLMRCTGVPPLPSVTRARDTHTGSFQLDAGSSFHVVYLPRSVLETSASISLQAGMWTDWTRFTAMRDWICCAAVKRWVPKGYYHSAILQRHYSLFGQICGIVLLEKIRPKKSLNQQIIDNHYFSIETSTPKLYNHGSWATNWYWWSISLYQIWPGVRFQLSPCAFPDMALKKSQSCTCI